MRWDKSLTKHNAISKFTRWFHVFTSTVATGTTLNTPSITRTTATPSTDTQQHRQTDRQPLSLGADRRLWQRQRLTERNRMLSDVSVDRDSHCHWEQTDVYDRDRDWLERNRMLSDVSVDRDSHCHWEQTDVYDRDWLREIECCLMSLWTETATVTGSRPTSMTETETDWEK